MKFWIDPIRSFFFFFFFSAIDKIDRVRLFESTLWKFLRPIGFVAIYFRNYPPSTGLILFLLLSSPSSFFVCPPRPNRSWKKSIFIRSHKFVSRLYDLLELLEKVLYSIPDFVRIRYYYAERVISTSILSNSWSSGKCLFLSSPSPPPATIFS